MTAPVLTGIRWSSVRVCPRMAVAPLAGADHRDSSDRERRILFRGSRLGRDYGDWLEAAHPGDLRREVEVTWQHGTGHIDLYLVSKRLAIEVLSSRYASDAVVREKMRQLVGYMEFAPGLVDRGALVVLDPGDFSEDVYPISRSSATYAELAVEAHERIAAVTGYVERGELPARECAKPNDAIGRFCRCSRWCFEDAPPEWTPAEYAQATEPRLAELAAERAELNDREKAAKAAAAAIEQQRKDVDAEIVALVTAGHGAGKREVQAGRYLVAVSHTKRAATVDLRKAEAAGYPVQSLDPYLRHGAEFDTVRVSVLDEPAGADSPPDQEVHE